MPTVIVENSATIIEISSEELAMVLKDRAKRARIAKREAYIAEINALIKRIETDGFALCDASMHPVNCASPLGEEDEEDDNVILFL